MIARAPTSTAIRAWLHNWHKRGPNIVRGVGMKWEVVAPPAAPVFFGTSKGEAVAVCAALNWYADFHAALIE